ncbi:MULTISPECIES: thiamine-phosphate kinase [unclassified Endozoicomonas]|uniref:thiamine-phosphate kinase n=1 Tax=unclassified Endozoicomonas TaxID=2644528 RepID=UPI003BB6BEAE
MATGVMGEFELIKRYFARPEIAQIQGQYTSSILGIGDDCALFDIPPDMQLAQSLDTLVEGVHFPGECDPFALGYRALAVSLSDLAAMGADPHSFTLGLTLPRVSELWLKEFSEGLAQLAQRFKIPLIGGDTTKGPLTLSLQVQGLVPKGQALLRSGARPGDLICITGTLGDAAGALPSVLSGETPETCGDESLKYLLHRYWYPSPRLFAGQWLRQAGATSALDISDGLLGDLGHILEASNVGAEIEPDLVPRSAALGRCHDQDTALTLAMTGGDDYELCFTIPRHLAQTLPAKLSDGCRITCIGQINDESGIIRDPQGNLLSKKAYTHF